MLMSKDAIADVVEGLAGPDFYRPAHQVIYDTILDLYGRGEPADAITVAAELNRTDQLSKMGGARSEEHTSELQSRQYLVCRLLLEKKKKIHSPQHILRLAFFNKQM